jgi:RNA:NAD 2'-phosphotransferase (TPT1/KptA family)
MRGPVNVVRADGFIPSAIVQEALRAKRCGIVTLDELVLAVDYNDKCRFQLLSRTGLVNDGSVLAARATYAHSLSCVQDQYLYMPVPAHMLPTHLFHATFEEHIPSIMADGLIPGGRRAALHPAAAGRDDVGSTLPEWRSHVFFSPVPPGHTGFIDLGN